MSLLDEMLEDTGLRPTLDALSEMREKYPPGPITTVAEVNERVDLLRRLVRDNESAHAFEDRIRTGVLEAIAERQCDDPSALAEAALTTGDLDFSRWYA